MQFFTIVIALTATLLANSTCSAFSWFPISASRTALTPNTSTSRKPLAAPSPFTTTAIIPRVPIRKANGPDLSKLYCPVPTY